MQLINADIDAGNHEIQFDASNLASGVYFYRIEAGEFKATKQLLLLNVANAERHQQSNHRQSPKPEEIPALCFTAPQLFR